MDIRFLMTDLVLQHGLSFADLYDREGLVRLDRVFVAHLAETDVALHDRRTAARSDPMRSSIKPARIWSSMGVFRALLDDGRGIRRQQILGACQRSAPCSKPPISPACARLACWRGEPPPAHLALRPFENLA